MNLKRFKCRWQLILLVLSRGEGNLIRVLILKGWGTLSNDVSGLICITVPLRGIWGMFWVWGMKASNIYHEFLENQMEKRRGTLGQYWDVNGL